ncbi:MAG: hypothetical protein CO114_01030 [Euryarchaeota archaeon CG_4_9_14_3_um_filter_38_12]|nr:MAG: hypothetical protein CO114_01030 [Euryarchaeota archaeon CG_4_9_14_3_um_filter_38_12]
MNALSLRSYHEKIGELGMAGCGREQAGVFQGTQAQETEGRETICVNVIFNSIKAYVGDGKKRVRI